MTAAGASRQVGSPTAPGTGTSTPPTDTGTATETGAGGVGVLQEFDAWLNAVGPGWAVDFVQVLLVLVVAWLISRLMVAIFADRVEEKFRRKALTNAFVRGLRVGVFVLGGLTVLSIYGYELGDIALSVTVFTAVVGVVLAPIVGSIISGVFLLADQPYEIGDMVELADSGRRGFVDDITLRYTKIFTLDNTFLVVPNGTMRERDVINYSAEDARTRLSLSILVTYESDVPQARDLAESAAASVDNVISGGPAIRIGAERYPAGPVCYIDEFGDHGVALTLRYWTERPFRLLALRSAVQTAVREAYQDADVEFAYPHSHLVFDETSGTLDVAQRSVGRRAGERRRRAESGAERQRATRTGAAQSPPPTDAQPGSDTSGDATGGDEEAASPADASADAPRTDEDAVDEPPAVEDSTPIGDGRQIRDPNESGPSATGSDGESNAEPTAGAGEGPKRPTGNDAENDVHDGDAPDTPPPDDGRFDDETE